MVIKTEYQTDSNDKITMVISAKGLTPTYQWFNPCGRVPDNVYLTIEKFRSQPKIDLNEMW